MAPAPYILARTLAEAHAYANEDLGLKRGQYRVVTSSGTIKSLRGVDLYLVPGWERRHDRFAVRSALRWTRMTVIDVAEQKPAPDGLDGLGEQTTIEDADAFLTAHGSPDEEIHDLVEDDLEPRGGTVPLVAVEPLEPESEPTAPKRRRRRCSECGILVDPDEVETHAAEHLPEGD